MSKFFQATLNHRDAKIIINVDTVSAVKYDTVGCKIYIAGEGEPFEVTESYEDVHYTIQVLSGNHIDPVQKAGGSEFVLNGAGTDYV